MLQFLIVIFVISFFDPCLAQNKKTPDRQVILIQASPLEPELLEQSSSVEVIVIDDTIIEKKESVAEVLRSVPGVEVFNQGGPGKVSKVFLRGTNSEHTLVLIDGIEVNDPMSPGRAFDFAHTDLNNIERIEVIKGPQSVAYGSDALGGVINIITKQGAGSHQSRLELEGGSFGSYKYAVGSQRGGDKHSYTFLISKKAADGFSIANEKDGNSEKDSYEQVDVTTKINSSLSDNINSEIVVKYVGAESELDRNGGPGADDPNAVESVDQFFSKGKLTSFFLNEKLESVLSFNYAQTYRKNSNRPDSGDSTFRDDFFKGSQVKAQLKNNYYIDEKSIFVTGIEYEVEKGKTNKVASQKAETLAAFTRYKKQWDLAFFGIGLRHDEHSVDENRSTNYQLNWGYNIKDLQTQLLESVASGFKSPSLFQLYDPQFGNTNLRPEEVVSWDVGLEYAFFHQRLKLVVTYFENHFENLISFDPVTTRALNLEKSKIRGVEWGAQSFLGDNLTVNLSMTHLIEFENKNSGEDLVRRSKNVVTASMSYNITEKVVISGDYRYSGSRDDFQAVTFNKIRAPSFDVVNMILDYQFKNDNHFFMRVNNLLNRDYEEIDGFGTAGFSVYSGLRLKL